MQRNGLAFVAGGLVAWVAIAAVGGGFVLPARADVEVNYGEGQRAADLKEIIGYLTKADEIKARIQALYIAPTYCSGADLQDVTRQLRALRREYNAVRNDYRAATQRITHRSQSYPQTLTGYDKSKRTPANSNFWVPYDREIYPINLLLQQKDAQLTAARIIDCSKPRQTTTGTTGTTAQPAPPQIPSAPSALDLPTVPALPSEFCSKLERTSYLVDVIDPLMNHADDQGRAWAHYRDALRKIARDNPGDAAFQRDLATRISEAERNEQRASAAARALDRARSEVLHKPIVDCTEKAEQPKTGMGGAEHAAPAQNAPAVTTPSHAGQETGQEVGQAPPKSQSTQSVDDMADELVDDWFDPDEYRYIGETIWGGYDCVDPEVRWDLEDFVREMKSRAATGVVTMHPGGEPEPTFLLTYYSQAVYEEAARRGQWALDHLPKEDCPCTTELNLSGAFQQIYTPRRLLLGVEPPGALEPMLGLLKPHVTADGSLFHVDAYPSWGFFNGYQLGFGFSYGDGSARARYSQIDPGLGNTLVIPGPRGGASGFSLGSYGGLNVIQDGAYRWDYQRYGGTMRLGWKVHWPELHINTKFSASIGYDRVDYNEMFGGSIPGYGRDFRYDTHVNEDRYTFSLSANPEYHLATDKTGQWSLGAALKLNLSQINAWGTDRLRFTGFPDSVEDMSNNEWGFGYSADLYLQWYGVSGLGARLGVGYREEAGSAVTERNGNDPSHLGLANQGAIVVGASIFSRF